MKNESIKYTFNLRLTNLMCKYCFYIFCFTLMPFDLLTFVTGTVFAESDNLVEYKFPQSGLVDPNHSSEQNKRDLLQTEIAPIEDENGLKKRNELRQLIEQIRAIEITPQEQPSEQDELSEKIPETEPNQASSIKSVPTTEKKKDYEPQLPYTPITDKTLQMLRNLSLNPQQIDNPFELAEILFHNGNHKEAALFYQEALNRVGLSDPDSAMDRAWILFQTGNCLREHDIAKAAEIYSQLIIEYPNSLWAEMARIQSQLITWYLKDSPQKIIAENKLQNTGIN